MIQNLFRNMTPVVKNLLMINIIFYVASTVLGYSNLFDANRWLAAHFIAAPDFRLWQIISYMFMHAPLFPLGNWGILHILFNMVALVSFGPIMERTLGDSRFLAFYFITGVGALVLQEMVQSIEVYMAIGQFYVPGVTIDNISLLGQGSPFLNYGLSAGQKLFNIYNGGLVGASGAIFGVLAGFGMLFPNLELMIIPIPMPVKAKYLVPGYVVLEIVLGIGQFTGDSVAHFAHIGGALVGFIVIKLWGYHSKDNFY